MALFTPEQALGYLQMAMSTMEWNADTADHIRDLLINVGYPMIEIPDGYRILIDVDEEYGLTDSDTVEEREKLDSGEWAAYNVDLEKQCECGNWILKQSVGAVVVESCNAENTYSELDNIPNVYLRQVAAELITEELAS